MDLSKYDGTRIVSGIFLRYNDILADDAEGCLFILPYGIQLVAAPGTVEIDRRVCRIIYKAQWNRIWISVAAQDGQDAGGPLEQNFFRLFLCQFLFFLRMSRNIKSPISFIYTMVL